MSPPPSCLPLTREVASPKGLTEGEINAALTKPAAAIFIRSIKTPPGAKAPGGILMSETDFAASLAD